MLNEPSVSYQLKEGKKKKFCMHEGVYSLKSLIYPKYDAGYLCYSKRSKIWSYKNRDENGYPRIPKRPHVKA